MMCPNCKKTSTYQRYELMYTHDQHAAKPYVRDLHPAKSQKSLTVCLTWKEFVEKLSELDMKRNGKPSAEAGSTSSRFQVNRHN